MDINLKMKIEKLKMKIKQLKKEITLIDKFLIDKSKYYKNKESILAIKEIKKIFDNKIEQEEKLLEELSQLESQIERSCNHEIIISDKYNNFCAICKALIIDIPDTTILSIEVSNNDYTILINNIINKGLEENKLVDYAIDQLEELQYSSDIKIKRLRK